MDLKPTKPGPLRYGIFAETVSPTERKSTLTFLKANGRLWSSKALQSYDRPQGPHGRHLHHAHMGNYDEAVAELPFSHSDRDTRAYRFKYGF